MLYELINPSDTVTFHAPNHLVACMVTAIMGGMYSCECCEDRDAKIPGFLGLSKDGGEAALTEFLGVPPASFLANHESAIRESLASFSYATRSERRMYDDALSAITDPEKLEKFKQAHEDRERSSMNTIVKKAWLFGKNLKVKS